MKDLMEVLTRRCKGIIVRDGLAPYPRYIKRLQRCWAYILRESKDIAEKCEEAILLHNALKELYDILTDALENDPPLKIRKKLWRLAQEALRYWTYHGVEPTNTRAERALRPNVILRKILGKLRNDKGTSVHYFFD